MPERCTIVRRTSRSIDRLGPHQLFVRVTDSGRGIAADQLERVFQPFVQLNATLTRTQQGTGLGLAISRELARGMGGDLIVDSTLGVGSSFTLALRHAAPAGDEQRAFGVVQA
jgi:signal transduction histidine kinase